MTQSGTGALAGHELALGFWWEVGQAQQTAVDQYIYNVFDDADQVGVEAGKLPVTHNRHKIRMPGRDVFLMTGSG